MKGEFYKMEFDAWDEGTVDLTLEEEAAYLRLCHQMYRRRSPVPNSDRLLCSLWRCHQNKARPLLQRLIDKGKIRLTENGELVNKRVSHEIEGRAHLSEKRALSGHVGGTQSGHVRRTQGTRAVHTGDTCGAHNGYDDNNPLKTHDTHEAIASSKTNQIREEESSKKDTYVSLSETSSDAPSKPPKTTRNKYPPDFEAFWQGYPTDALMSKKLAFQAWQRLDEDARTEVVTSLPAFRAYCASKPDYRPVHAVRYITQHRSEGFVELAAKAADRVFVAKDTPEWEAWQRVKKVQPVMSTEHHKEGWWFPSRFPAPAHDSEAA